LAFEKRDIKEGKKARFLDDRYSKHNREREKRERERERERKLSRPVAKGKKKLRSKSS